MRRLRFETVRDLLEAFPIAEPLIEVAPSDEPSLRFLEDLVRREDWDRAVGFCAFLLPRRDAVWWGCRTVRALLPTRSRDEEAAIRAAEKWVQRPEDDLRLAALELGTGGNSVFVVNAAGPAPMTIFGRPLIITEKAGQLGARGDLAFVDLSYYLVGDRQ